MDTGFAAGAGFRTERCRGRATIELVEVGFTTLTNTHTIIGGDVVAVFVERIE